MKVLLYVAGVKDCQNKFLVVAGADVQYECAIGVQHGDPYFLLRFVQLFHHGLHEFFKVFLDLFLAAEPEQVAVQRFVDARVQRDAVRYCAIGHVYQGAIGDEVGSGATVN